jgi:DNA polymerase III delta prime subunit
MASKLEHTKQTILYGPPGTGKTYTAFLRAHEILFGESETNATYSSIKKKLIESYSADKLDFSFLTWTDAIFLAFKELKSDKVTVSDLKNTDVILGLSAFKNREKNISNTLWSILQQYSVLDSKTVHYQHKNGREYFDKNELSQWFITESGIEYFKTRSNEIQAAPPTTEAQLSFVTFHQSYSYEEFIEGYRPDKDENAESDTIEYQLQDGLFKRICNLARKDHDNNYVLVIDEINRGNISKIFGELITVIEDNKRIGSNEEITVTLPYSRHEFGVPPNVYIIGTMNSTDKSIALVDIALRRRFKFEKIPPKYSLIKNLTAQKVLKALNKNICALKNSDFIIGHSYFMKIPETDTNNEKLREIFISQVLPLIEEYFYNDWEALATILGKDSIELSQPTSKIYWNEIKGDFEPNNNDDEKIYGRNLEDPEKIFDNVLTIYAPATEKE